MSLFLPAIQMTLLLGADMNCQARLTGSSIFNNLAAFKSSAVGSVQTAGCPYKNGKISRKLRDRHSIIFHEVSYLPYSQGRPPRLYSNLSRASGTEGTQVR